MNNDTLMLFAVAGVGFVLLSRPRALAPSGALVPTAPQVSPSMPYGGYGFYPPVAAPQGVNVGGIISGFGSAIGSIVTAAGSYNTSRAASTRLPDGWVDPFEV